MPSEHACDLEIELKDITDLIRKQKRDWLAFEPDALKVLREGVIPCMSEKALFVLFVGMKCNDSRIIQGATTRPPPLQCVEKWPCEAGCGMSYAGWMGDGLEQVGDVEEYFARMCFDIDQRMGEPAACRLFLNWWDDAPRDHVFTVMIAEIQGHQKFRESAYAQIPIEGAMLRFIQDAINRGDDVVRRLQPVMGMTATLREDEEPLIVERSNSC